MEFGAVTAKKFSNGYGVSGKSAYDGVFAAPIKFKAPSLSSSFEDYCEIFGGSEASLGSSIPILEVPELNERKYLHDVRRSKLDYSKVFGGFANLDAAVPYEEVFGEHRKKDSFSKGALSPDKGGSQSSKEGNANFSKEIPPVSQETSFSGVKKINIAYHKVNQGSENRTGGGTTHIAQLHAVPAYTCLVEEINPSQINSADKSKPVLQQAYPGSDCREKIKESERCVKSASYPTTDGATKQSSSSGVKVQDRSDSIHMFFDTCEGSHGSDSGAKQSSNGGVKVHDRSDSFNMFSNACEVSHDSDRTDYIKVPTSQTVVGDLDNDLGHAVRSMATKFQASKRDASEVVAGADSPVHSDDMVDSNSEAAASVAALRKAIEEAQERLKVAKDLMKRKKGFPDRVKRSFNNDLKAEGEKGDKFVCKTMKREESNFRQPFRELDALRQVTSVVGKPMMRVEPVNLDHRAGEIFIAKEAVREVSENAESTLAENVEDKADHKEADHEETVLEFEDASDDMEMLHTVDDCDLSERNAGKIAFEKPTESHQTLEVTEGSCEQEANKGKLNSSNEAGGREEHVDEKTFRPEEHVDDTMAQETFDYGEVKNLKVEEDKEVTNNKVAPFLKQEECEKELDGQGLSMSDEEKINWKPEDDRKDEELCEQEDCSRNMSGHQGLAELQKEVVQQQKESEVKVEVSGDLKECELRKIMEQIDNEEPSNPHDSDLISKERQMENVGCEEDLNQGIENCSQREGSENIVQEVLEDIVGRVDDEEGFHEIMTEDSDSDRNERVQYAKDGEMELEGANCLMENDEKYNSKPVEVITVHQNGPNSEEKKREEVDRITEISPDNEPDESENSSKIQVASTSVQSNKIPDVTPEGYSHNEQDDATAASNASLHCEEKYHESEPVQEVNDRVQKRTRKRWAQGALELKEEMSQMQNTDETASFHSDAADINDPEEKVEQSHCLNKAENNCNLVMLVKEPSPDFVDICKYAKEVEDSLTAETDEKRCNSSDEELLVDNNCNLEEVSHSPSVSERKSSIYNYREMNRNPKETEDILNVDLDENICKSSDEEIFDNDECNLEASQPPNMSEWKSSTFNNQDMKGTPSNTKENHQATITMEEKKASDTSQKVELETDHPKKIDEAKEREREREREKEKEKIAVERAIREARERAFAEARERAALERAAAEARRKNISDGRERLGRMTGQANEKSSTERAAIEAKLKAQRAAVERATAEARARALERALSEKAASEARNKSDKFFAEKSFGGSRDNGMRPNFHSKSFSYGDTLDGADGDSAQRCKARSERHQRIDERVAKALAEKNARDRLVQKEQEEKNRVAETLDADVKRWSSGKEGNLRALLSTLQYILGPDSGWKPIHLTDIVNGTAVKKAYRKATLFVHPDKLQQRGATIQQKYICEKVFDLLKEAWNRFNMEER